jgi:S-adenosylmethionine-dependent methyltransferase
VGPEGYALIRESLRTHYYQGWRSPEHYSSNGFAYHYGNQIRGRTRSDRWLIVPWLDAAKPLDGSSILEIGCGTGSSTVALAEQGARVVGVDVLGPALTVARDRCAVYEVSADFHCINANAIQETFTGQTFDFVIFFASLEHLTIGERLVALRDSWSLLPVGGLLVIVETPNRLWYYDGHTSLMPFFHWLPDELAFQYSRHSTRENFQELYRDATPEAVEHFLRQGRGVSFHEFDLAIRPNLDVVSSLSTFHGLRYKPQRSPLERLYKTFLRRVYPTLHEGFCDDTLFLIIKKTQ